MADIFTPEKRSWVMSRIRGKNTKIDLMMKKILSEIGYRYKMYPKMFGNPDFIIPSKKIAIFCDGDFWHGFDYYNKKKMPKKFWRDKIEGNMRRDRAITRKLRYDEWTVLRFWEHDIEKKPGKCMDRIIRKIRDSRRL
ncbi:MAG: very short patch repair endonuclease [Thaumarchaeota archaeon]|nr:very short patch repair endonuclease [Nitrososphaerota archaeon]